MQDTNNLDNIKVLHQIGVKRANDTWFKIMASSVMVDHWTRLATFSRLDTDRHYSTVITLTQAKNK